MHSFLIVAALVTFIWILLMRWLAAPIVWLTLVAFVGLFGFGESYSTRGAIIQRIIGFLLLYAGTYYSFMKWYGMKDNPDHDGEFIFTTNLDYYANLSNTWLAFGTTAVFY